MTTLIFFYFGSSIFSELAAFDLFSMIRVLRPLQGALIFSKMALPSRFLVSSYICMLFVLETTMNTLISLAFLLIFYLFYFSHFSSIRCHWLDFIYFDRKVLKSMRED